MRNMQPPAKALPRAPEGTVERTDVVEMGGPPTRKSTIKAGFDPGSSYESRI